MSRRRVVVTGLGAVTPLGNDASQTWEGAIQGRSGIAKITHFDASNFPSQIAGEVKNFDFSPWVRKNPKLKWVMSNTKFALSACDEAIEDSGLKWDSMDPRRRGIYYAAGDSAAPVDALAQAFHESFTGQGDSFDINAFIQARINSGKSFQETEKDPAATLQHLIRYYGIEGPAYNCLTACAASAQAIGEGCELIRRGEADVLLSGGRTP